MSDAFSKDVAQVIQDEGGLSINKADKGGITKYGISLKFLQEIGLDINKDGIINAEDILSLTPENAQQLYKIYFWDNLKIFTIDNQEIANKVFNLSVNMGGRQAIMLLQEAINFHVSPHIVVDGIIGKNTLAAIDKINPNVLLGDYGLVAKLYYERLVAQNPNYKIFLDGWLKRAAE